MIAGILLVEEDMVRTTDRVYERSLPELELDQATR
jgi:hypothetical protein